MKGAVEPVRPRCLGRADWCFPDENSALARGSSVRARRHRGRALVLATRSLERLNRRRKTQAHFPRFAAKLLNDLANLPIALEQVPAAAVFSRLQRLNREHGLTAYDAAYLDLALDNGLPLATLDHHLIRAVRRPA